MFVLGHTWVVLLCRHDITVGNMSDIQHVRTFIFRLDIEWPDLRREVYFDC